MPTSPYTALRLRREQRHMRLVRLGYRNYDEYLRSPHWAKVRAGYAASPTLPQDCICGEAERLQLHHTTYERIGAEDLSDLTPLCPTCHAMIHTLEARGEIGLDFAGLVNEQRAEKRRREVEAMERDRHIGHLMDLAFLEDLEHQLRAITKMPGGNAFRLTAHRIKQELRRYAAKLDATR